MKKSNLLIGAAALTLLAAPAVAQQATPREVTQNPIPAQGGISTPNSINTTGPATGSPHRAAQDRVDGQHQMQGQQTQQQQGQTGLYGQQGQVQGQQHQQPGQTGVQGQMGVQGQTHMQGQQQMQGQTGQMGQTGMYGQQGQTGMQTQGTARMGMQGVQVIASPPVPDTAENRRRYPPLSSAGRRAPLGPGPVGAGARNGG